MKKKSRKIPSNHREQLVIHRLSLKCNHSFRLYLYVHRDEKSGDLSIVLSFLPAIGSLSFKIYKTFRQNKKHFLTIYSTI